MTDLGKPTIDLVNAVHAIVERDIGQGFITPERLRFTIEARKAVAKELAAKGMSLREIGAVTGQSKSQIDRDIKGDLPKKGQNVSPNGTPATNKQSSSQPKKQDVEAGKKPEIEREPETIEAEDVDAEVDVGGSSTSLEEEIELYGPVGACKMRVKPIISDIMRLSSPDHWPQILSMMQDMIKELAEGKPL
jgi:transposase